MWGKPFTEAELTAMGAKNADEIVKVMHRFHHRAMHLEPPEQPLLDKLDKAIEGVMSTTNNLIVISHNTVDVKKQYPAIMPSGDWDELGDRLADFLPMMFWAYGVGQLTEDQFFKKAQAQNLNVDLLMHDTADRVREVLDGNMAGCMSKQVWQALAMNLCLAFGTAMHQVTFLALDEKTIAERFALLTELFSVGNYPIDFVVDRNVLKLIVLVM